jgi:NAD(P)-dependent dehydrogenase (short-subunit alcohol dehydrogenase family)
MNKLALVTGSSRGIGRAIAIELANSGYDLIIHHRNSQSEIDTLINELENKVTLKVVKGDLSNQEGALEVIKQIKEHTNKLDLLVNNAGGDTGKTIEALSYDDINYSIYLNLVSKMVLSKELLPLLKESEYPSIINISSRMGKEKTIVGVGSYAPAEAGIIKWTQCCALEFADYGIRVNTVAPGFTDTDLNKKIFMNDFNNDEAKVKEVYESIASKNPRKRLGKPEDIAKVVRFIASNDADYINGEVIGVNGGSNLG